MTTIAFIGLGNMGGPMAANLVKAGHKVIGFDLVRISLDQAKADGATIAGSAVEAVKGADVVITMLPAGKHVVSVWSDVIPQVVKGALMIDCSTIDVESARQAHALAGKASLLSVDAPVSGGTAGAKGATLTFMAGGDDKAFAAAKPILEAGPPADLVSSIYVVSRSNNWLLHPVTRISIRCGSAGTPTACRAM